MTCYCARDIDVRGSDTNANYNSTTTSAKYKILEDIMEHKRDFNLSDHDIKNILLLINLESRFNPDAISGTNVVGLMQVTEKTFVSIANRNNELQAFINGPEENHTLEGEAAVPGWCAIKDYSAPVGSPDRYYTLFNTQLSLFDRRDYIQSLNAGITYYFQLKRKLTDGMADRTKVYVGDVFANGWGSTDAKEQRKAAKELATIAPRLENANLNLPWEILSALTGQNLDIYSYLAYLGDKYGFDYTTDATSISNEFLVGMVNELANEGRYNEINDLFDKWRRLNQEHHQASNACTSQVIT